MNGANFKLATDQNIATLGTTAAWDTTSIEYGNLLMNQSRVEVQVDWAGLTGTLNGTVQIQQRGESTMQWTCLQPTEADAGNMIKTLATAAGSYTFTLWAFTGANLRVLFTKTGITAGTLNVSLGMRG